MQRRIWIVFTIWFLLMNGMHMAQADETAKKVVANMVCEWAFTSQKAHADPFNDVTLDALVTAPDGSARRVPAFWDGGQTWRVRYASGQTGTHHFRTECSDPTDAGLHHVTGTVVVTPYRGRNALYRHGPVRVASDTRHFEHADGTPFLWLGDTWWMGLSSRLHWPDEFQTLASDRKAKGFNVVQIVAGLYPEMPPLDPRGVNEAGLPWEPEYRSIRPAYFQAADHRLQHLIDSELTPCIVGAWGYFEPFMGRAKLEQHWRYLIARYGASPVIWCVAGEVNLPYYKVAGFPFDDRKQVGEWTAITRYVRDTDPFRRVLTVHPTGLGKLSARGATLDPALLDYDMLQTGHGGVRDLTPTLDTIRASYNAAPTLPIVQGEVNYEALLGADYNDAALQRLFVWNCLLSGCAGYTYGGNGVWQINREGEPSTTFGGYYNLAWEKAMRLPGSAHVGMARKILLPFAWETCAPHPEWVQADAPAPFTLDGSAWIWFPEGNPVQNAPVEKRWFRRVFTLPADKTAAHARLKMSADDSFTVWLNGHELGSQADWKAGRVFAGLEAQLKPGANALAVLAANEAAPVAQNPAGLIAKLEITFTDGSMQTLVSDAEWRASRQEADGWRGLDFNDSAWPAALVAAPYGQGPWGRAAAEEATLQPSCAGSADHLRLVYLPHAVPVTLTHLEPHVAYNAQWINPTTGQHTSIGRARSDAGGLWHSPAPPASGHDWLLVLTTK